MGMSVVRALILKVGKARRKRHTQYLHHESILYISFPMQKKADKKQSPIKEVEVRGLNSVLTIWLQCTCKINSADGTTHMTSLRVEVSISAN